jgi:hypothetical protein
MTDAETAAASQAITAATTQTPTPTPTATVPVAQAAPITVPIPTEQLAAFLAQGARIAALESQQTERERLANEEKVRILTEKNDAINAVKLVRETHATELKTERDARLGIEDSAKRYALDGALNAALAASPILPAAAPQLAELFRKEFVVVQDNGTFVVRTPTFQSVEDFVKAKLADPAYAHFVRATTTTGGTAGTTGAHHAGPTAGHQAPAGAPTTLAEAFRMKIAENTAAGQDGRTNYRLPMPMQPVKTG